jgi:solute carrier family 26 (sodium-independent sulfate anion transporter), member 11
MLDLIAGLTVGAVVVPQSMSYAKIATLPVEYGLYSSFVGVFLYCFFATSKDVTIGPVAVMSLQTAKVIQSVQGSYPEFTGPQIATALALLCGSITLGIGLIRLGFIVEFIPAPAIAGFMTGSAITIAVGQVPSLLGTSKLFDTRAACYLVIINTLKNLPHTTLDAAFGLPCLFVLYAYRYFFGWAARRWPKYKRWCFYALVLRNAIVVVFITIFSYLVCRHNPTKPPISILLTVPRGFQHVGSPFINSTLASALGSSLPVSTVVLLLEHIAISKSFGRINDYKIIPDQELIAIGVTNMIGSFFNAYPATGSFSRSAIKSKSGVRTPLAGIITGIVVILALYALTGAFYWIPNAGLAAGTSPVFKQKLTIVIIHAVGDLVVPPKQAYRFWRISPLEFIIFMSSVIVTIFTTLEDGIYVSVGASIVVLLYRIARPRGEFLGRVRIQAVDGLNAAQKKIRAVYVPLRRKNMNPDIHVDDPPPGVLIYRFEESFTYPNASRINDRIVDYAKQKTRRGLTTQYKKLGDRPWNEGYVPRSMEAVALRNENDTRPILRAVVYDFGGVSNIDSTGIQSLVDTRQQLDRYADRQVEFHFAQILSPWIKRALVAGGFGTGNPNHRVVEVASIVPVTDAMAADSHVEEDFERRRRKSLAVKDEEGGDIQEIRDEGKHEGLERSSSSADSGVLPVVETNYPFFHLDLDDAVRSAERATT